MAAFDANSTVMSILRGAVSPDATDRRQSLRRFCEQYTDPLVNYLRLAKRFSDDQAEELVQEFWTVKLLEPEPRQNIVAKFLDRRSRHPSLRFRQFIYRSLSNFGIDKARQLSRRGVAVSLEQLEGWEPDAAHDNPEFDAVWASHILKQVVTEVRDECDRRGQSTMWQLFVAYTLRTGLNAPERSMAALAAEFGFESAKQASSALITISRKFDRVFRLKVSDYLPIDDSQDAEMALRTEAADLWRILSRPGGVTNDIMVLLALDGQPSADTVEANSGFSQTNFYFSYDRIPDYDLAAMWQALLEQSVVDWLPESTSTSSDKLKNFRFGELSQWASPDLAVLNLIRRQAKSEGASGVRENESRYNVLPSAFLSVIYLTAIAVAYLQLKKKITRSSNSELTKRLDLAMQYPWLDPKSAELFDDLRSQLQSAGLPPVA